MMGHQGGIQGELRRHVLTHHHFGESVSINLMPDEAI